MITNISSCLWGYDPGIPSKHITKYFEIKKTAEDDWFNSILSVDTPLFVDLFLVFNRFYIIGLCKRSKEEEISEFEVYRAKERAEPRGESELLIGRKVQITDIEAQLLVTSESFKSPLVKPNSGISVRLPWKGLT